ncbi:MAG: S-methyl-5-thioribose-1-phosphate isomerase [Ignavibacteriae bacterium]|nr:MAG: S-methyl-5-thioribose-1-phosphate isomerase [Ignavibacteriota bacterium]
MKPLEWINGKVRFLDQTKLPLEEVVLSTDDVAELAEAIRRLAIRGAPLIGIAAAYGVALASLQLKSGERDSARAFLQSTIDLLASTRPTAVNLFWALKRQRRIIDGWETNSITDLQHRLIDEALLIHQEDYAMCEHIAVFGVDLLPQNCSVLTHCNSGILATGGRGTALGIITKAWEIGKLRHVFIDETRPLFQGARLTAWEMNQANVPATLIVDNTAAVLMKQGKIDAVLVGADRIAMNGDAANKVGTYNTAIIAKHHGIPLYVAAPVSTMDFKMKTGQDIPIEERDGKEVSEVFGRRITPQGMTVYAPAFDVTPNELISAIVTNRGVLFPPFSDSIRVLLSQI